MSVRPAVRLEVDLNEACQLNCRSLLLREAKQLVQQR